MRKQHLCIRILALILAVLLLPNVFSGVAAEPDTEVDLGPLSKTVVENVSSWNKFKQGFSEATSTQTVTFQVEGKVLLPEPLINKNGASFVITGKEGDKNDSNYEPPTILPSPGGSFDDQSYLLNFSDKSDPSTSISTFTIRNLTLDGDDKCGLLRVSGYHRVYLGNEADAEERQGDGSSVLRTLPRWSKPWPLRTAGTVLFSDRARQEEPSLCPPLGRRYNAQRSEGLGDCPCCRALSDRGTVPLSVAVPLVF